MEKHAVARLVGAPPGYVGYEEGGQLTEAVRRHPYTVILLDEIEKAHPDVFNILLQILDEGRLTDSKGRTVDFKNTLLIMTSNLASAEIMKYTGQHVMQTKAVHDFLNQTFRPEFLNRIDDTIIFQPLTKDDLKKIVNIQVANVAKRLEKKNIRLEVTTEAATFLSEAGFDEAFGARPLKRVIQEQILDPLSLEIIEGKIKEGEVVTVDSKKNQIAIATKKRR
jgi:ATP-dependent Clp protease ATP-binding subunit ClpB